ncbi:hypothetical protein CTI12_AA486330 [Artemisia annua]|uniref:Uncharacterized protein n=1 Tax=Artemisia annua TaxID=35608 RepID=A0A2U1LIV3_ARTAN|nr:hypothetical protein CTI12_AA486330 [Artemisia annua]
MKLMLALQASENADVSIDAGNKEFIMDETDASVVEQETVKNAKESAIVEIQRA